MTTWKTLVNPPLSISALAQQQLLAEVPPLIYSPPSNCTKVNGESSASLRKSPGVHGKNQSGNFSVTSSQYPLHPAVYEGMRDNALKSFPIVTYSNTHEPSKLKYQRSALDASGKRSSDIAGALHRKARRFNCPSCSRKFYYMCHLKVHERVHTREKPYACNICCRSFSQSGSLRVHMRRHTGVKPYQCFKCWRKFRHVNSLLRHQRQVHHCPSQANIKSTDHQERSSSSPINTSDKQERMEQITPSKYFGLTMGLSNDCQPPRYFHTVMNYRERALQQLCLRKEAFGTPFF